MKVHPLSTPFDLWYLTVSEKFVSLVEGTTGYKLVLMLGDLRPAGKIGMPKLIMFLIVR